MPIKKISDYREKVMHHYSTGTSRGAEIGFKTLNDLITIKLGYTTFLLGFAAAGKTEFHFEILFNLTEKFGWKHALLSAEVGAIEDVIAELISKYLRKPFYKSNPYAASEKEVNLAMDFLSEYFFPVDGDSQDYDVETFYADCEKLEKDNKIKLQTTSLDPWNDLDENLSDFGGREDKYLTWALKKVRQTAKKNNWHNFIVTHAKDMPPIALKNIYGKEAYCTAIPTLQSFAGGQVWGRRAMNVAGVWRPEQGIVNPETSMPFEENEAKILILKSKPKGVGKKGSAPLYFDWRKNRYCEKINGKDYYGFEYEKMEEERKNFVMPISTQFNNDGEDLLF
jgi:hypothetical protein